ncbi:MAG: RICIN domain-containing protein [Flammeovirgaceae bacterium]
MKSIFTLFLGMVWCSLAYVSQAQNQVFSLVSQQDHSLVISVKDGDLAVLDVDSEHDKNSQKFILKRLINGNIMIASAAHPERCFKHTGTTVELAALDEHTADFEWKIEYIANDEYLFKHAALTNQCLAIEDNQLIVAPIHLNRRKPHRGCCRFVLIPEDNPF